MNVRFFQAFGPILIAFVLINACTMNQGASIKYKELRVRGEYSFEIPEYLREKKSKREYVILHYQHLLKEVFLEIEENDLNQYLGEDTKDLDEAFELAKSLYRISQAGPVKIDEKTVQRRLLPNQSLDDISPGAEYFLQEIDNPVNRQKSIVLSALYKYEDRMIILTLVTNKYFRDMHEALFDHIIQSYKRIDPKNRTLI